MLHDAAVQGIHWQVSPMSLHHRSTTDSGIVVTILVRRALTYNVFSGTLNPTQSINRALAEVCTVPMLLVVVSRCSVLSGTLVIPVQQSYVLLDLHDLQVF